MGNISKVLAAFFVIAYATAFTASVQAGSKDFVIFKCTAENGTVHFEMDPPKDKCKTIEKVVHKRSKKTAPPPPMKKTVKANKPKKAQKDESDEDEEEKSNIANSDEICEQAQRNLEVLTNRRFVTQKNADGEDVAMTDTQKETALTQAQQLADQHCE